MLEATITRPTETTAFRIRVYTKENAASLTAQKKLDIANLYIERYSTPKWGLPPGELKLGVLVNEIDFALCAKGGMVITVEDVSGKVVGFRLAFDFSNIIDSAKGDSGLAELVGKLRSAVDYEIGAASYTADTCVSKSHEGNGLGRKMMDTQIAIAMAAGAPAIIGWTVDSNTRMIALYNAFGYTPISGMSGITVGSDYNVDYAPSSGKMPLRSETYQPLTYRHLIISSAGAASQHSLAGKLRK